MRRGSNSSGISGENVGSAQVNSLNTDQPTEEEAKGCLEAIKKFCCFYR